MTIKELKGILEEAPSENAQVFICKLPQDKETDIVWNYDDNNDLDLDIGSPNNM